MDGSLTMGCCTFRSAGRLHIPYYIGTSNPTRKARKLQKSQQRPAAAPDDDISALAQLKAAVPLRPILEGHDHVLDPEARGGGSAAPGTVAARPRITALGRTLAPRATAWEGESERGERLLRARVVLGAGALVLDGAVPVQGKALE